MQLNHHFALLCCALCAPGLFGAGIRDAGNGELELSGKNYTVRVKKQDGTFSGFAVDGRALSLRGADALWTARFADGRVVTSTGTPMHCAVQGSRVQFSGSSADLKFTVTMTALDDAIDLQSEITPQRGTILEFGAPGRLIFSPETLQGVICHPVTSTNPGVRLKPEFFLPAARLGKYAPWKKGRTTAVAPATRLFGRDFQNLGNRMKSYPQTVGPDAAQWLDAEGCKQLESLRLCPTRPFRKGQAEIVLLSHDGNVTFGGSRFGGKGAFLRIGGFVPDGRQTYTVSRLVENIIRKMRSERKFTGKRHRIALIRLYTGEVNCKPAAREWAEMLHRAFGTDFFEINSEEELAAAVASPETAAIVNPYGEICIAPPGRSLTGFMDQLREFVRSGGCWFETGGYSFYYQFLRPEYLTTGRSGSPKALADFFHISEKNGAVAVYSVQPITWKPFSGAKDPAAIYIPSVFELGGCPRGGFLDRTSFTHVTAGTSWKTPVTRFAFTPDGFDALRRFCSDNRMQKKLSDKASPQLIEQVRNSVLYTPPGRIVRNAKTLAAHLKYVPVPAIVHTCAYLRGGFDKQYPDHLPPAPKWASPEEFRALIRQIRESGRLFMPYVNNTWWCDHPRGPTFAAAGNAPLQIGLNGKPFHENYGSNDGWSITMWHPAVRAANDRLHRGFTDEYPSDIIFQDQCGARGIMGWLGVTGYDLNPASPTPYAKIEGTLSQVRTDASKGVPLATEEVWWGLIDHELMICGFTGGLLKFMQWQGSFSDRFPSSTWELFPVLQALAHDRAFLTHHDLAGNVSSPERVAWTLALGFNMVSSANIMSEHHRQWLNWLDRLQKSVCARYAGGGVKSFRHTRSDNPQETGIIRAVYGPISVVANLRSKPLQHEGMVIAPNGCYAAGGPVATGELQIPGEPEVRVSFVTEPGKAWLLAPAGTEAAFPAEKAPGQLRLQGKTIPFRMAGRFVIASLPAMKGDTVNRLWELDVVQ